jgi:hypothetical protein
MGQKPTGTWGGGKWQHGVWYCRKCRGRCCVPPPARDPDTTRAAHNIETMFRLVMDKSRLEDMLWAMRVMEIESLFVEDA